MKLTELDPTFLVIEKPGHYRMVDELVGAHGVQFLCPKCFEAHGGESGTHYVGVWFRERGVPEAEMPGPARWSVSGTSYADLTLSPSILLTSPDGCRWHGFVTNGEITSC